MKLLRSVSLALFFATLSNMSISVVASAEWWKWPFGQTDEEKQAKLKEQFLIECEKNTPWNDCKVYTAIKLCQAGDIEACERIRVAVEYFKRQPRKTLWGMERSIHGENGKTVPWEWIDAAQEVLQEKNKITNKK